jgi:hypothetical protein
MNFEQKFSNGADAIDPENSRSEFDNDVTEGGIKAVSWGDFITDATALTHLKGTGRGAIKIDLGYLPPDYVMTPFEPYLRALIQMYWQEAISEDDFCLQLVDHIKLIRNADMKHNRCQTYDEVIYENYRLSFVPYGYAVRERLSRFLGYEPALEHSLIAEMWMRDLMADDSYLFSDEITPEDIRAVTLIKYREVLLTEGQQAADASPLWGCMGSD